MTLYVVSERTRNISRDESYSRSPGPAIPGGVMHASDKGAHSTLCGLVGPDLHHWPALVFPRLREPLQRLLRRACQGPPGQGSRRLSLRVAKFPDSWHAVPVRHRKPGSLVDEPDVEVSRDPVPLEVRGKPTMFVVAQESKAPSGISLAGHDTLGQFLALQRTVTEVESESDAEPTASGPRLWVLVLGSWSQWQCSPPEHVAVLYAHPA